MSYIKLLRLDSWGLARVQGADFNLHFKVKILDWPGPKD